MLSVIVLNSVVVGVQTDEHLAKAHSEFFTITDQVFLALFMMEIFYKWYYGFRKFWTNGWNVPTLILMV
jgi:predicted acyltransferase